MKKLYKEYRKNSILRKISAFAIAVLFGLGIFVGNMPEHTVIAEGENTLQSLIDGAADGATVKLTGDSAEAVTVAAGKNITLDLAGYTLGAKITNSGTLTLVDSTGGGAVRITSAENGVQSAIVNSGTFTLDGATVEDTGTGSATEANAVTNNSGGKIYIKSGEITATSTSTKWGFGINNLAGGIIEEISGGRVVSYITHTGSASNAVAINNNGTIKTISGGTVYAEHRGGDANTGAGYAVAIRLQGSGVLENMTGGRLEAKHTNKGYAAALYLQKGTVKNISGGTLYAENTGDKNYATALSVEGGTVENVSGGTLSALVTNNATDNPKAYGIFVQANGTVDRITGGDIVGKTTARQWAFGINNVGTINSIEGGTISAIINHNLTSPNAVALCNDKTTGAISGGTFYAFSSGPNGGTIGIRTRNNATIGPITGGAVYINKVNSDNYFRVEGSCVNNFGEGYSLGSATASSYRYVLGAGQTVSEEYKDGQSVMTGTVKSTDGSVVKEYKLVGTELAPAASISGVAYDSISEAATAANANDTLVVGRDIEEDVIIPAGKTVTVDFNGYKLTGTLTNNGTATLVSSKDGGGIYKVSTAGDVVDAVIYNHGTLTVDGINIRNDGMNDTAQADGIYNYAGATLEFKSGTLQAIENGNKWAHAIVNEGNATVSGGNIRTLCFGKDNQSNIVAIANSGAARLTVTGGNIYAQCEGKGGGNKTVVGIRLQGTSSAEITGGSVRSVVVNASGVKVPYGVYIQAAGESATVSGGTVSAETFNDYAFGVFNEAGTLNVTGGRIKGSAFHKQKAPNIMGIATNSGTTTVISGGYISGYNANLTGNGDTYGVRNRGTLTVNGGVFGYNKTVGKSGFIFNDGGTLNYATGVTVRQGAFDKIGYAYADGDVVVEQRDDGKFIGVDVFRGGECLYAYNEYKKSGYILNGFTVGSSAVSKADFAAMTASAVADAVYAEVPTYLFLGSSVTYGHANHSSSFVNYIASMTDCRVIKEAVSGTTLTDSIANSYLTRLLNNVSATEKVDHLIVQLSTNDATRDGVTIGDITSADKKELTDFDKNTTVGAMEYIIAYAKKTWNCKVSFYTNPKFDNANYTTLLNMLDKVKAKWDIGVIDFYNYKDMDALDNATLSSYMADAIHPNALGYKWMAEVFVNYLENA